MIRNVLVLRYKVVIAKKEGGNSMAKPTKRANKFKLFCMARGYTAKSLSELIREETGAVVSPTTIHAYYQGKRFPGKRNMELLISVFGDEVLSCFYEEKERENEDY